MNLNKNNQGRIADMAVLVLLVTIMVLFVQKKERVEFCGEVAALYAVLRVQSKKE